MSLQKNTCHEQFLSIIKPIISSDRLLVNEPLSKHTTFCIGGPADYLIQPRSTDEVAVVLRAAKQSGIALTILGNGSNVLVLDKGIRGVVIKFDEHMSYIRHDKQTIMAGAGAVLADVAKYACEIEMTGLEFAIGIPGSVGGAVYMNAGAYEGELSSVVAAVTAVCPNGTIVRFLKNDIQFGYRHSVFQENGCVICEIEFDLCQGNKDDIQRKMTDLTIKREHKQPLEMPSAGSTFKRPPGHFAGTLIEQAGLKGLQIGGAQVSTKHAGFIVNAGGATACDVLALIKEVQRQVYDKFGVHLHPEVRIIGE